MSDSVENHRVVAHEEWLSARRALLAKEKEFTRMRDEISRERRALPWEKVEKAYVFEGPNGKETLAELFGRNSQLVVYHFMFAPDWDAGCKSCSFWADNFNGIDVHLRHRDISFVAISRAPFAKLAAYEKRMGWNFKWLSSYGTDFNYDLGVAFTPEELTNATATYNYKHQNPGLEDQVGISVFYKDPREAMFHSYSCYSRGVDMLNGAYNYIDLTPKGRDEGDQKPHSQAWVRRHDEYED